MKNHYRKLISLAVIAQFAATANAFVIKTDGEVDFEPLYEGGQLIMSAHDHANEADLDPADTLFYVGNDARVARFEGSAYDFLGVSAGQTIWHLPDTEVPGLLYLGIGAEDFAANDPAWTTRTITDNRLPSQTAKWLTIEMVSMSGPGQFSVWQNTDDGPVVWLDTANGITETDRYYLALGSHNHLNWAFTQTGLYSVALRASGYLDTNMNGFLDDGDTFIQSGVTNYNFGVEAVPEPATMAALGLGVAALARRRKK